MHKDQRNIVKIITIVKLIDHILKTLPKIISQYETIAQDHKLKTICKNRLQKLTKRLTFFKSHT